MATNLQMRVIRFDVSQLLPRELKAKQSRRSGSGLALSSFSLASFKTELEVSKNGGPFEARVAVLQDLGLLLFRDLRDQSPFFVSLENATLASESTLLNTSNSLKKNKGSQLAGTL